MAMTTMKKVRCQWMSILKGFRSRLYTPKFIQSGDDDDEESEVPMDVHIEGVSFPIIHTEVYTIWRGAKRIRGVYYLMNMEFSSQLDAGTVIVSRTRPGASEPEIVQMKAPSNLVNDCYENRRLDKMREWGLRQLKVQ